MQETRTYHFEQFVQAPPEDVLRAFTHATALRDWLCDSALCENRVGGGITLRWNGGEFVCGSFTRIDPPDGLAFTWNGRGEPGEAQVAVTCTAQDGGTLAVLEHTLGSGVEWEETAKSINEHWPGMLENLQSVVETGIDLRIARRPRLGIIYDELTAEKAAELKLPKPQGVLLVATAENSGARAAGLVKDDVLASLNGVTLEDMYSFDAALQGLKAGDRPVVEYYRGGQKHAVELQLGSFPMPELPGDAAQLAERVNSDYQRLNGEMDKLFAGLSEAQASRRPGADEWSIRELVAHFILCERDYQGWVADMLNDRVVGDDFEMRPNVSERIAALAGRLGSLPALREELKLAQAESCAMLAALPEKFLTRRKHLYRRAAAWALEVVPNHFDQEHAEQIKKTLDAVKG